MSEHFFDTLKQHGHLRRLSAPQFFDTERGVFLNGRQVIGRCPIQGCQSDKAYADECSLGHQFLPKDLIGPRSALTGTVPKLRECANWYFDLAKFKDDLEAWVSREEGQLGARKFANTSIRDFFGAPVVYVPRKQEQELAAIAASLPNHQQQEGKGKSLTVVFDSVGDREQACEQLSAAGVQFRSGKTLVPFRLSGNINWGIPVPDEDALTFWVWPESLWAPISFSATYLEAQGESTDSWQRWWCDPDAKVYQFIGEDNVYFYGPAEMGLFLGMQGESWSSEPPQDSLQLPTLVVNRHLLFLNSKASSSGKIKPPMADELLEHYTAEQLRVHFVSLGLGTKNISFQPKVYNPSAPENSPDPVLKEGKLLTNVFNRAVRTLLYTVQTHTERKIPQVAPSEAVMAELRRGWQDYEQAMASRQLHRGLKSADKLIRNLNKFWQRASTGMELSESSAERDQALADAFQMLRVAVLLMHPIVPAGCERIRSYLNVDERLWSWEHIEDTLHAFVEVPEEHQTVELPPRTDFFAYRP